MLQFKKFVNIKKLSILVTVIMVFLKANIFLLTGFVMWIVAWRVYRKHYWATLVLSSFSFLIFFHHNVTFHVIFYKINKLLTKNNKLQNVLVTKTRRNFVNCSCSMWLLFCSQNKKKSKIKQNPIPWDRQRRITQIL